MVGINKLSHNLAIYVLSLIVVAFGQPAWSLALSGLSACCGFALFWKGLLAIDSQKKRFWIACSWFALVQLIQLSWLFSHPYGYIYAVAAVCCFLMGLQFALVSVFISQKNLQSTLFICALAGAWTLLEWTRLFFLSGLPFNPVGLSLTASLFALQLVSFVGVYGLSFYVIVTNLLLLRAYFSKRASVYSFYAVCALLPYLWGGALFYERSNGMAQEPRVLQIALVQPALPIEEGLIFHTAAEKRLFILNEWRTALAPLRSHLGKKIDLIVFPEYLVPYGTCAPLFSLQMVNALFEELFSGEIRSKVDEKSPYIERHGGQVWVSNGYLAQEVANLFQAHVVIGFEDHLYEEGEKKASFSSAFHFVPQSNLLAKKYDKQILLPMGEYIPFDWCRSMAARYGISGSFTAGKEAVLFEGPVPFGASICYEEMYGHLMRENRLKGAELLVNLTNDGWYPGSRLPKQHFDHARLRSVENGFPLVRACNTGLTAAVDSRGVVVARVGDGKLSDQKLSEALLLELPLYHYPTLYARFGDWPVMIFSTLALLFAIGARFLRSSP